MRLLMVLILLGFPLAELWLLFDLLFRYGWTFVAYLVLVGFLGYRLLQDEKFAMMGRVAESLRTGQTPVRTLFGLFKNSVAGILLIIPGVITDAVAVVLLLLPSSGGSVLRDSVMRGSAHGTFSDDNPSKAQETMQDAFRTSRARGRRSAANDDIIEGEFRREDD